VAAFPWNGWQLCYGISGSNGVEYAGRPEETNRYWRVKEIALNVSGSYQEFLPSGENVPGAATMITNVQLVRVGQ
jgi:hypothetical protein